MHLYTIGYATKALDTFIAQLKHYKIDVLADVRSVPYSKVFTDYHRENLSASLKKNHIRYVYLGEELGPRSKDPCDYDESGQVQFDRLMAGETFKKGIKRLQDGIVEKRYTVALMCAEKDPATCHRSLLIGYYLTRYPLSQGHAIGSKQAHPLTISHIDHNGNTESQEQLEARIATMHNTQATDLFMTEEQCAHQAYEKQLKLTSYIKGTSTN